MAARPAPSRPASATQATANAVTETPIATIMSRANENGSMSRPTSSVVTTKPAIIMSHTIAAARPRRSAVTRSASKASSGVPAALTPSPMITNATAAASRPSVRCVGTSAMAATASAPPKASSAMPMRMTGVRRPPASDQKPRRGRKNICTAKWSATRAPGIAAASPSSTTMTRFSVEVMSTTTEPIAACTRPSRTTPAHDNRVIVPTPAPRR